MSHSLFPSSPLKVDQIYPVLPETVKDNSGKGNVADTFNIGSNHLVEDINNVTCSIRNYAEFILGRYEDPDYKALSQNLQKVVDPLISGERRKTKTFMPPSIKEIAPNKVNAKTIIPSLLYSFMGLDYLVELVEKIKELFSKNVPYVESTEYKSNDKIVRKNDLEKDFDQAHGKWSRTVTYNERLINQNHKNLINESFLSMDEIKSYNATSSLLQTALKCSLIVGATFTIGSFLVGSSAAFTLAALKFTLLSGVSKLVHRQFVKVSQILTANSVIKKLDSLDSNTLLKK